jgi:hypothetical protein
MTHWMRTMATGHDRRIFKIAEVDLKKPYYIVSIAI